MATIKDTSTVARKDQDFSVYQRIDPRQRIDWGAEAKKITDTVDSIRDDRARRKAKIEKNYRKQQEKLQDMGDYEAPDLQQKAIQTGQNLGSDLADANQLLKQGLITENEYSMASHNIKSGAKLFKNIAETYDGVYKVSTERIQKDESSFLERDLRNSALGYVNLDGIDVVADMSNNNASSYGSVGLIRKDNNGNIIGEAQSLKNLSVKITQQIDKFQLDELATETADELGNYIVSDVIKDGLTVQEWEYEYSRIKGDNDLMNSYLMAMGTDTDYAGLARRLAEQGSEYGQTPNGTKYETGTRAAHEALDAKLKKEGKSLAENNIIIFEPNDYELYEAELSDEQKENVFGFAREILLSKLDDSQTVKTKLMSFSGGRSNRTTGDAALAIELTQIVEGINPANNPTPEQKDDYETRMDSLVKAIKGSYYTEYDPANNTWTIKDAIQKRDVRGQSYTDKPTLAIIDMDNPVNIKSFSAFVQDASPNRNSTQLFHDSFKAAGLLGTYFVAP